MSSVKVEGADTVMATASKPIATASKPIVATQIHRRAVSVAFVAFVDLDTFKF